MLKIKSWPKLIFSIILAQSAGFIGTFFTISSIPTWYALLNKPSFSPPNWLFGPVWTVLYTLIGISLYLIWTSKKGSLKLFLFHLFLNAIWSPIFFGAKNLGLALLVIVVMDITLVIIINNFYKINRIAGLVLVPYLLWIGFATVLNFSFWQLNPSVVSAQDFNFAKAREDYVFSDDKFKLDLFDFNLKKAAYQKNPTLSLKEELRLATYKFVGSRNNLIKSYLTMIRIKVLESKGLSNPQKETLYSKIDPEVVWFDDRKNKYELSNTLEDIIRKTKEEDQKYSDETTPVIYYSLAFTSLGDSITIKNKHIKIYELLKNEANELVTLGRADAELFERWFKDIDNELVIIDGIEKSTLSEIDKIFGEDVYRRQSGYEDAIETITPIKQNLLRLNGFIMELENTVNTKR
ncbi:MAG: TspO/MBR family protein [Patescibacteria group bacterium]